MSNKENLIGIIADSHGKLNTIVRAAALLQQLGCGPIFHLGDVCDSMRPETADACVDMIKDFSILAVKGNNDHAVVVNHRGMNLGVVQDETIEYLRDLPLSRTCREADMAHSMPFVKEMGLSAMIGVMGEFQAHFYFSQKPQGLFFRGHSHEPTIACISENKYVESSLKPGELVDLAPNIPCIITCGALTRGYATVWNPEAKTIRCLSFLNVS